MPPSRVCPRALPFFTGNLQVGAAQEGPPRLVKGLEGFRRGRHDAVLDARGRIADVHSHDRAAPAIHIAGGGDQQPDLEDLSGLVRVGCGCVGFTAIGNCRTVGTC